MTSSNSSTKWEPDATIPKFSCKLCPENVSDNNNATLCDLCQTWVHIKCNNLNYIDYKYLQGCNKPWYCLSCTTMLFPFGNLINQKFLGFVNNNNDNNNESKNWNSSLILKPLPDLGIFFNQFNNAIPENNNDPENVMQSKYYNPMRKILSLFHINSCSLNKNFEELQKLVQSTKTHVNLM